jgi:heme oxygenase
MATRYAVAFRAHPCFEYLMLNMHERLRQSTRQLHDAVEKAVALSGRVSRLDGYVDLLDRLWSLHAGFERALQQHDLAVFSVDLDARRRSQWLVDDLQALAGRTPSRLPVAITFDDAASAVGGLYVLEGSTLGGQALLEQVTSALPVSSEHGARFFTGHGDRTGAMWKEFLGSLARVVPDSPTGDRVERGAVLSFETVQQVLASASVG